MGWWEEDFEIPTGGSIKVLIRTQGERFKVLKDDEGCSTGKPEPIAFPSSGLIAERDLTWAYRGTQTVCSRTM